MKPDDSTSGAASTSGTAGMSAAAPTPPAAASPPDSALPGLRLDRLGVRLHTATQQRDLVAPLSLHIAPGEVVALTGPSGSGKSSLLAAIAGILPPPRHAQGQVRLDGRLLDGLPPEQRRVGLMLQDDVLFPHLTVAGNLLFALPRQPGLARGERLRQVQAALARAELPGLGERYPDELSGGQRARVALMRTLLAAPRAVLLDEPFSRLDAPLRARLRPWVWGQLAQAGVPTLLVTHDPDDVPAAARVMALVAA